MSIESRNKVVENFGKNVSACPTEFLTPESEQQVLEFLRRHHGKKIRVISSGHAWSAGIQTDAVLMSMQNLKDIQVNETSSTVRVGAGCKIKDLLSELRKFGLTLPSIGLIDEQTLAGATATGTHGSGKQSLSHFVTAVRVAHYDSQTGEPTVTRIDSGPELQAARCSLGMLGVIVELEVQVRKIYNIEEHVVKHKSLDDVVAAEKDSPLQQFFLIPWSWQWYGQHRAETDRPRTKLAGLYRVYWHLGIDWGLHLIITGLARILKLGWPIRFFYRRILPLTLARNWRVVDDSHKMLVMEHELFRHIEVELFVTRQDLQPALTFVRQAMTVFGGVEFGNEKPSDDVMKKLAPHRGTYLHHYPICIRRVLNDDTMISMACSYESTGSENELANENADHADRQDCYAISMISYHKPHDREGFVRFADFISEQLSQRFAARPHWGKYNSLPSSANDRLYPRLDEFREIVKRFDAGGVFSNDWLDDAIGD